MPPAVSVVVAVYNPGPYLRPLLHALDRQQPPTDGFEAVLVDDGSTDGSGELLERWARTRAWAVVVRQPNSGWPSRPRNAGIDRARGEFVLFVDHDDWIADDALARRPLAELVPRYFPGTAEAASGLTGTAPAFSTAKARRLLGWRPAHRWRDELAGENSEHTPERTPERKDVPA